MAKMVSNDGKAPSLDKRPTEEEVRIKIMQFVWGGVEYEEFIQWLKDKLLIKPDK